ncbi:unnamed protein product [Protopolystoma xenopodis]|uniref:Uncharacterized protein n=1 Tax=Protopolystoma xenopodis TaxID=117903 RepID=A0A448WST3_9PLAT|nr:unnamed protein product [Protopolystoma xenopodis]
MQFILPPLHYLAGGRHLVQRHANPQRHAVGVISLLMEPLTSQSEPLARSVSTGSLPRHRLRRKFSKDSSTSPDDELASYLHKSAATITERSPFDLRCEKYFGTNRLRYYSKTSLVYVTMGIGSL